MGFTTIKREEAIYAHQSYYKGDFEVMPFTRSGFCDFFPFSMIYGISDIGSWEGLISTDGTKVVITKSKFTDMAKVKKAFEFTTSDIKKVKFGPFKTYFTINHKIPGLTMSGMHGIFKLAGLLCGLVIFLIYPFLSKKALQLRLDDQFKNKEKLIALLQGNVVKDE